MEIFICIFIILCFYTILCFIAKRVYNYMKSIERKIVLARNLLNAPVASSIEKSYNLTKVDAILKDVEKEIKEIMKK